MRQCLLDSQQVVSHVDDVLYRLLDLRSDALGTGAGLLGHLGLQNVVVEPDHDRDQPRKPSFWLWVMSSQGTVDKPLDSIYAVQMSKATTAESKKRFGQEVRALRLVKGLTLRLVVKVSVGFMYISKVENGKLDFADYLPMF